jgi:hypothetical protein
MASNLYPLIYKPGIKKDGTPFQSEYCTDGKWIRFNEGKVKKIGGMIAATIGVNQNVSNLLLLPNGNNIDVYIASTTGINSYQLNSNFNYNNITTPILGAIPNAIWQSEVITNPLGAINILNPRRDLVYLGINNLDVDNDGDATLYSGVIGTPLNQVNNGFNPKCNSGLCFAPPFLFVYGSGGLIQWSAANDPLVFNGGGSNSQVIANDKIIYGKVIRGGINTPTILFWSLSSVIRFISTSDNYNAPTFSVDTISRSSSILSSRCVVEYDGVFFWPGIDRFFVYNGLVQEVLNNINFDYFFDNIDMDYRQNVFGIKNPKYGEIWWFYPEKINTPGRPNVARGINTRALIYNKRENAWYDTAISRNCGVYSDSLGLFTTYGNPLENNDGSDYLWFHEQGITQNNRAINSNDPILSSFTTPTISWAAFNPLKQLTGVDRWMEIKRIEPDFAFATGVNASMNVIVNTQEYAQLLPVQSAPYTFSNDTGKIDIHLQGRHITFTFSSSDDFEMGHVMLLLSIGDGR